MRTIALLASLGFLVAQATPAAAAFITRPGGTRAIGYDLRTSESAVNAGVEVSVSGSFDQTLTRRLPGTTTSAEATASQRVDIGDSSLTALFSARADADQVGATASARGYSTSSFGFRVLAETPFVLDGQIESTSSGVGTAGRQWTRFAFGGTREDGGAQDLFFDIGRSGGAANQPLHAVGVLHTGWSYSIEARTDVSRVSEGPLTEDETAESRIEFVITVPEPAAPAALLAVATAATALGRSGSRPSKVARRPCIPACR